MMMKFGLDADAKHAERQTTNAQSTLIRVLTTAHLLSYHRATDAVDVDSCMVRSSDHVVK
jgi:hypothetical protein